MAKTKESKPENGAPPSYTAKDIYVLEGLEPVRKRPGMYIGSTGVDGLHHLIWEVFDNSMDEAMAGHAKNIAITLLPKNFVRVVDDGRGIPVDVHKQTKKSALETVLTTLHAGGKFGSDAYKVSGGLHGVGVSVVNALSVSLTATVCRDGAEYEQRYARGIPQGVVKKIGKCEGAGTAISFAADPSIFEKIEFDLPKILTHIRQQAYLTRAIRITIIDSRDEEETKDGTALEHSYSFYFEGGIASYVHYLNRNETPKHEHIFYCSKEIESGADKKIFVETALQYTDDLQGHEVAFANNIYNGEGGTHLTGFRTALTRALNDYARKNDYLKKDEDALTGDDVREGLTAVISVKIQNSTLQFEGQTKSKLGNPEARTAVESVVGEALKEWLEQYPRDAEAIIGRAILAQKARKAAKAARETVLRKGILEGLTLPGKLADCQSKKPEESELFIVEGDSAGGCFSGETKVALLDGRSITFQQLLTEQNRGKQNFCYTIKADGTMGVEKIEQVRITKKSASVVKIILDNGETIVCTPDHKFMLRDGSYKEAAALNENDSLMPLYRQYSRLGKRITIEGYELVFDPQDKRWIFTHLLSDHYNIDREVYPKQALAHRHHRDFNKLNNNPDNITRLTKEAHLAHHATHAEKTLLRPDVREKLKLLRRTPAFRAKMSRAMTTPAMRKLLSARAKKQWENREYKQYMAEKFSAFLNSSSEYRGANRCRLFVAQQNYWSSAAHRKVQAERVKNYFQKHPEQRILRAKHARQQWSDPSLIAWRREETSKQWTADFRLKRQKAYDQTYLKKALMVLRKLWEREGSVNESAYNAVRRETRDRSIIRLDTVCTRFFDGNRTRLNEAVQHYNHKIKAVIPLTERMDVYDLEVPGTHNFALASGVFVHNSAKQGRDRRYQAILPLRGKILNVERARLDKMLASKEVKALIIALGAAIGDEFDEKKLRYHRIIIATDADVDGAHIRTLLMTLFYRYFPSLIEHGYLYIAMPPLYRIQARKNIRYVYSDEEKERTVAEFQKILADAKNQRGKKGKMAEEEDAEEEGGVGRETTDATETTLKSGTIKGIEIQRYKGLGEMNPSQLWETTMDPAARTMRQVNISDAAAADNIFNILMGDEVLPRKKFIQTHAKAVKNLDI